MTRSIFFLLVFATSACGDDGAAAVDYSTMLQTVTTSAVLPEVQAFGPCADDLATALGTLQTVADANSLAAAQTAWRKARACYRKLDSVTFGPIDDAGYENRIDDWAHFDAASIDAVISGTQTIDVTLVGTLGGGAKGFLGVQYLLFSADGNAAALTKLTTDASASRRLALALACGQEIANTAHSLASDWSAGDGGFALQVETAGSTSSRYPRQRGAVDAYASGIGSALELVVGTDLAVPLGKKDAGSPDPKLDITNLSDNAVADMTATMAGARAIYDGGLSAQLRGMSAPAADAATAMLTDCAAKIAAIPAPFATALTTGTAQAAYESCKDLKASWNTDISTALGATAQISDQDGD